MRWARKYKLQFRLEETNTLAIQGLAGASDTLAAALFYIDYALTMMKVRTQVCSSMFANDWVFITAAVMKLCRNGCCNSAHGVTFV